MSELKEKGIKLELNYDTYKLFIDGKFIIESKDLDYVLEYVKDEDISESNIVELW